jgi:5-(carboxyamino)imidazole ribonucleotide synthase
VILPGATIGLLGGGQLGRMTAFAARSLGYDVHALDPDSDCPARPVSSRTITARFDDADAAAELARHCQVVTLEIEQIAPAALAAAAALAPLRPNAEAVRVVQDRITQRRWLEAHAFPVGAFRVVASPQEAADSVTQLGRSILKAPRGGYDGRGQVRVATTDEARRGFESLGGGPVLVEQFLELERELSMLVARRPQGVEVALYPLAQNHHEHGILDWSMWPASVPPSLAEQARDIGRGIAEALDIEGLIAVELFVTRDGRLTINELAPRPHNTFHHSERACSTSQFEQFVRAVCDLPLGSVAPVSPGAIANLLGDLWHDGQAPDYAAALEVPAVRLHLYGKASARPGRKMGHLSAVAATPEEAARLVLEARERLTRTR